MAEQKGSDEGGATMSDLYGPTGVEESVLDDPEVAHLSVNHNEVLGSNLVPGLHMDVEEMEDGIRVKMVLDEGTVVKKQVHMCFGMMPEEGVQRIDMEADIGAGSRISILAHCVFPNAVDVSHIMDAGIRIGDGASYTYLEKHIHSPEGGIRVIPKAEVELADRATYKSEFELVRGRVGLMDMDYEVTAGAGSVIDMLARMKGSGDDEIRIREVGHLNGEDARGVLKSNIAVLDSASAEVYNEMTASAAGARGHMDCKEVVRGEAVAKAIPIVDVRHPLAHITHEAAVGSVDSKQLQTLMARGMEEDDAVDLIIDGLLNVR